MEAFTTRLCLRAVDQYERLLQTHFNKVRRPVMQAHLFFAYAFFATSPLPLSPFFPVFSLLLAPLVVRNYEVYAA